MARRRGFQAALKVANVDSREVGGAAEGLLRELLLLAQASQRPPEDLGLRRSLPPECSTRSCRDEMDESGSTSSREIASAQRKSADDREGEVGEEVGDGDVERSRDAEEGEEGRVGDASFDCRDVVVVHLALLREPFLRQPSLQTQCANATAEHVERRER